MQECIQQFVQLPIEDELLQQLENGIADKQMQSKYLPFKDAANPIMAQVAFLASMVAPQVAAASAQTALHQIAQRAQGETEDVVMADAEPAPEPLPREQEHDAMQIEPKLKQEPRAMLDEQKHEPKPDAKASVCVGMKVQTRFGIGTVVKDVRPDSIIELKLDYGELFAPISEIRLLPLCDTSQDQESGARQEHASRRVDTPFGVGHTLPQPPALKLHRDNVVLVKFDDDAVTQVPATQVVEVDDEPLPDHTLGLDQNAISVRILQTIGSRVTELVQNVAEQCLAAAAIRAKELSKTESREIFSLVAELVETQMKKIELKLRVFEEMQAVLHRERTVLEQTRQEVAGAVSPFTTASSTPVLMLVGCRCSQSESNLLTLGCACSPRRPLLNNSNR